jgi:hypothetical protein
MVHFLASSHFVVCFTVVSYYFEAAFLSRKKNPPPDSDLRSTLQLEGLLCFLLGRDSYFYRTQPLVTRRKLISY